MDFVTFIFWMSNHLWSFRNHEYFSQIVQTKKIRYDSFLNVKISKLCWAKRPNRWETVRKAEGGAACQSSEFDYNLEFTGVFCHLTPDGAPASSRAARNGIIRPDRPRQPRPNRRSSTRISSATEITNGGRRRRRWRRRWWWPSKRPPR